MDEGRFISRRRLVDGCFKFMVEVRCDNCGLASETYFLAVLHVSGYIQVPLWVGAPFTNSPLKVAPLA